MVCNEDTGKQKNKTITTKTSVDGKKSKVLSGASDNINGVFVSRGAECIVRILEQRRTAFGV